MDDIGSVEEIQKWAAEEHSEVTKMEFASQFRCNGSNGYLAFVDDLLEIRRTANWAIDDLRYENGRIVTDFHKRASTDQSIRGLKTLYKAHPQEADRRADEIIKNTYRTLMIRGMKGCYVYCTDPGLQMYLRRRLSVYADEVGKMTKNSCAHGKQTKR